MRRETGRRRLGQLAWTLGVLALAALGTLYLRAHLSPAAQREALVGTWRCAHVGANWRIVLREDGTGAYLDWDEVSKVVRSRDITWSADTKERWISIQAVQPTRGYEGDLGGRYEWYDENLELHHAGGPNPGTYLYVTAE